MRKLSNQASTFCLIGIVSILLLCLQTGRRVNTRIGRFSDSWLLESINATVPPPGDSLPDDDAEDAQTSLGKCAEIQTRYPSSIPPLVHWTSRDGQIPAKLVSSVLSWRRLLNDTEGLSSGRKETSPTGWRFMHWNDKQISRLISKHYPLVYRSYAKLVNGLERSDIGRLAVLHHVGGLYVDTDVELLQDISALLKPSRLLLGNDSNRNRSCCSAIWVEEPVEHAVFIFDVPRLISNAITFSRANHSFLSYVLDAWPDWFEANWANRTSRKHGDAVYVTGPVMLQALFDKYSALKPNEQPTDWSNTLLTKPDLFQPRFDEPNLFNRLKKLCAAPAKLTELKRRHCQRLSLLKFKNSPIPRSTLTAHAYMHLSYTHKMDLTNSRNITSLLPISRCRI